MERIKENPVDQKRTHSDVSDGSMVESGIPKTSIKTNKRVNIV